MLSPSDFFKQDTNHSIVKELIANKQYVWDILPEISVYLKKNLQNKQTIQRKIANDVYIGSGPMFIHASANIEPGAYIEGPAYIGPNVVIRHGAYIRENTILLDNSLVGHSSEVKNSLFLPGAHAPHFNYVGDSLLGSNTNLGAGTKLSNLTLVSQKDSKTGKRPTIKISVDDHEYDTTLAKLGAILGDNVQTGCNSVLNPGVVIGPNSLVYANISLRKGYYAPNKIIKLKQEIEFVNRL